ncbi:hypothetical protein AABC73_06895 [Pseudomonas sp. G.S.17]|uniref:hypothetical protein n=1 Tax=Pseudomonas sp. G.S.17 TaxID=3137451 RepID=UPI00311CB8E2
MTIIPTKPQSSRRPPLPKSARPLPSRRQNPGLEPARLYGSFNSGILPADPMVVIEDLLRRVAITEDPSQKLMQAQRAIGAFMGFTAINAGGCGNAFFHKDVFARLAALTGETPDHLVTMAGVAR